MSGHSILPVTEADIPTISRFLAASKLKLAINRFLFKDWPNKSAQTAQYTSAIESSLKNPDVTSLKVVDDTTQEIIAHLGVTHRKPSLAKPEAGSNRDVPPGMEPEVFWTVTRAIREINEETATIDRIGENNVLLGTPSTNSHPELTWIYVSTAHRKRGIGSELVRLASEKAKAAGLPLAVGSEPQAYGFFLKQGFKDTKHADIDLRRWAPDNCGFGVFRISGMIM